MPYVAHIDVLGMSALVEADFNSAWSVLHDLVAVKNKALSYAYEYVEAKKTILPVHAIGTVVFSDTLLLYTKASTPFDLQSLLILATEIFHKALCGCVPVRVGISGGDFRFDERHSMYAGPALIDAYRVGEQSQWLGIVLSDVVRSEAMALSMRSGVSKVLVPWQVPLKSGFVERLVVNWPAVVAHDFKVSPPISIAQFYAAFERAYGLYAKLPPNVQEKYENTVSFINAQLLAHRAA